MAKIEQVVIAGKHLRRGDEVSITGFGRGKIKYLTRLDADLEDGYELGSQIAFFEPPLPADMVALVVQPNVLYDVIRLTK